MRRIVGLVVVALLLVCGSAATAAGSKPMTNKDVIALVKANLSQDSIITAINTSKHAFDTSAQGLIGLSKANVPEPIIKAMMEADSSAKAAPVVGTAAAPAASASGSTDSITMVANGKPIQMHYFTPEMRAGARAFGFGGMATYAVLRGPKAMLRITDKQPSFLVAIPSSAQPQNFYTVVSLAVRKNESREILTGGGGFSTFMSTGYPKERIVASTCDRAPSQAHAPAGFTIYKITMTNPLAPGEYAVTVNNSVAHITGAGTNLDSYFDFGVD